MSRPRLAVIGAGSWGMNHVRAIAGEPTAELVAVVDPDASARTRVHTLAPAVATYADCDEVLACRDVDAVVIATPSASHADLAIRAISAGKHVLIEKPLALTAESAREVARAALGSRRTAMVGHLMVHHPALEQLQQRLRGGELGPIRYVYSTRANLGRIRDDESVLWSFGPHDLSMLDVLMTTKPTSVTARGQCVMNPRVEDVVFVTIQYSGGELVHLHLSRIHPRKVRDFAVVCELGVIQFDDVAPDKLRIARCGVRSPPDFTRFDEYLTLRDADVHLPRIAMQEPLQVQLRHFIRCMSEGLVPATDIASGVRTVELLAAAQRSIENGGAPIDL